MRLIIKEFLSTLKEKDELDFLLCDILLQDNFITQNIPKSGGRQYGVDIHANKKDSIYLFVVKQGNLDRKTWDDNTNAIRPSINEILDVYLRNMIQYELENKKIYIVVVSNGYIDENVRMDWNGFVERNKYYGKNKLIIDFWNIDAITDMIHKLLFNENLFNQKYQSALRKTLYFIDEGDFKISNFESIVDLYIKDLECNLENKKKFNKCVCSFNLCINMIVSFAWDFKRYKITITFLEKVLLAYWKFLLEHNLFEKPQFIDWLNKFITLYYLCNKKYYVAIKKSCERKFAFPFYNIIEHRILLYEVIGYLSSYGLYLYDSNKKNAANNVLNTLISLLNNNGAFKYPLYDNNMIQLSLLFKLLIKTDRKDNIYSIISTIIDSLTYMYVRFKKYPTPTDELNEAIDIEYNWNNNQYDVTAFWGFLIEWIVLLDYNDLYDRAKAFINTKLENISICSWHIKKEEERFLYDMLPMYTSGSGINYDPLKEYEDIRLTIYEISSNLQYKEFSFNIYSFPALEAIICRHQECVLMPNIEMLANKK